MPLLSYPQGQYRQVKVSSPHLYAAVNTAVQMKAFLEVPLCPWLGKSLWHVARVIHLEADDCRGCHRQPRP